MLRPHAIMKALILATIIWAFSFSLIGVYLSGKVDPYFSAWFRILLAMVLFLPLLLKHRITVRRAAALAGIGAVQLGSMYLFYYLSFEYLSVPEVLIFTIFTPIYVSILHDLLQRRMHPHFLLTAAIAVFGAAVIRWGNVSSSFWLGFLLVQGSNLCFACGQVLYRLLPAPEDGHRLRDFATFNLGALLVVSLAWWSLGEPRLPTEPIQWAVLFWLGFVASGIGYFLWNTGATRVNAGALAIMNNALIPAGLLVNVLIWNREVDWPRLAIGTLLIAGSLLLNESIQRRLTRKQPTRHS
jgi:carboxylate/amino acid/amine transporter